MRGASFLAGGLAALLAAPHHYGRTRYPKGYGSGYSIAARNRNTGEPHEHKREVARRVRQAGRNADRRLTRMVDAGFTGAPVTPVGFGLSRRGKVVPL